MESARNHTDLTSPHERIDILSESDYQALNAHVFPTIHSLKWFIRKHRNRLSETGSVLLIAGRTFIAPKTFSATAISIGSIRGNSNVRRAS